jgi:hypothetical protein
LAVTVNNRSGPDVSLIEGLKRRLMEEMVCSLPLTLSSIVSLFTLDYVCVWIICVKEKTKVLKSNVQALEQKVASLDAGGEGKKRSNKKPKTKTPSASRAHYEH